MGQALGLAGLVALLVGLVVAPAPALRVLWGVAVPLLPATFLISPALWRGVCPLASLNAIGNRMHAGKAPGPRVNAQLGIVGMVLFFMLVPLRPVLFNSHGVALAFTAGAVGLLAVFLGARYETRSGFCNGLCPILPVERLYGQAPLLRIGRGRCVECSVCTPRGCLDLAGDKSLNQVLGPARRDTRWLNEPFGVFAAALPGFIAGYYALPATPAPSVAAAYAAPLLGGAASVALTWLAVLGLRLTAGFTLVILGAAAVSLHSWFAGPVLATALGLAPVTVWALRAVVGVIIVTWAVVALKGRRVTLA